MKKLILSVLSLTLFLSSCVKEENKVQDKVIQEDVKKDVEKKVVENDYVEDNEDFEINRTMPKEEETKKVVIEVKKENADTEVSDSEAKVINVKKPVDEEDEPIDVSYISGDTSPTEGDADYVSYLYENKKELFEDLNETKSSKDDLISQIDVEKSLRKTDPSVRPPWLDENADQINGIISSTIPENSLVIGTDFYDVQPGGQERVDLKNKEWVNISSKYTGVNYKYNGDGKNMYLAAHLSPYGKEIRNKTNIYFKDLSGKVKKYYLESVSEDIPFDTPITGEWKKMFRGTYGRNAIIFQTCEPRGNVYRYYVFIPY